MTKLYHPTIPDVTVDVEGADLVKRHQDAGWLKSEPKAAKEAREAQAAE